jgi:hypothetical protein
MDAVSSDAVKASTWLGGDTVELQTGRRPIVDDKAFGKILAEAPTWIGLERIVRCGLLRFAQKR